MINCKKKGKAEERRKIRQERMIRKENELKRKRNGEWKEEDRVGEKD